MTSMIDYGEDDIDIFEKNRKEEKTVKVFPNHGDIDR
jgi:hypothetical protein